MRSTLFLFFAFVASAHSAETTMRVLVYNIHAGKDAAGVDNLERVAALVASTKADIVLLQEVDRNTQRSGNVDHFDVLRQRTKMHGVFGKSLDYQGGLYGIAILSRWPIVGSEVLPLRLVPPQPRAGGSIEPRIALLADIMMPRERLRIMNTHLDASRDDTWRGQEVEQLVDAIANRTRPPQLTGGDFNSTPDSRVHERMVSTGVRDSWLECGTGEQLTYPADTPVKRIDYLYLNDSWRCTSAKVLESQASDHRPVLITLRKPSRK